MICQIIATKKGIGVLVNNQVNPDVSDNKKSTFEMIVDGLDSFYKSKDLDFDRDIFEHEKTPREKWRYHVYDNGGYHGSVNILYYGQKTAKDETVKPTYYFTAERFGVYFNVGDKTQSDEERKDFLKYIRMLG